MCALSCEVLQVALTPTPTPTLTLTLTLTRHGKAECVAALLNAKKADVNIQRIDGLTACMIACYEGQQVRGEVRGGGWARVRGKGRGRDRVHDRLLRGPVGATPNPNPCPDPTLTVTLTQPLLYP